MPRLKDLTVSLPAPTPDAYGVLIHQWDSIKVAALYDMRDELKENNRLQREILRVLQRLDRRVQRHAPLR